MSFGSKQLIGLILFFFFWGGAELIGLILNGLCGGRFRSLSQTLRFPVRSMEFFIYFFNLRNKSYSKHKPKVYMRGKSDRTHAQLGGEC